MLACIPNVSEGRRRETIAALRDAAEGGGARLLDLHSDADHHRSVLTFVGEPDAVERSLLAVGRVAVERIDLRRHGGVHPRIGALDVAPFVPLRGSTMARAVASAHRAGRAFAAACAVPVFFYGEAAARPERRELPSVRTGGFERLRERLADPAWAPDVGPALPHPTAGASVIGARGPLIAFNAVLDTADVGVARRIARELREAGGGLAAVRALGVFLASRGRAQVTMNLLDYRRTSPVQAAVRLRDLAARHGARVLEYELVGCAPRDQFDRWPADLPPVAGLAGHQLLDPGLLDPE
jgi:glutamate formiminotransferase